MRKPHVYFVSAPRDPAHDADHPLARAFRSFTEAAGSLERTYGQLQRQVAHLRQELEVTNRDLTSSLKRTGECASVCTAFLRAAMRRCGYRIGGKDFNFESRGSSSVGSESCQRRRVVSRGGCGA